MFFSKLVGCDDGPGGIAPVRLLLRRNTFSFCTTIGLKSFVFSGLVMHKKLKAKARVGALAFYVA